MDKLFVQIVFNAIEAATTYNRKAQKSTKKLIVDVIFYLTKKNHIKTTTTFPDTFLFYLEGKGRLLLLA